MRADAIKVNAVNLGLALLLAAATSTALIVTFTARKVFGLTILAGALGIGSLVVSGNPRLFCLWGLLISAPLDLSKRFMVIAHMGGASAFRIELVDFFLAGLVFFILRDLARGYRTTLRYSGFTVLWGLLIVLGTLTLIVGPYRTSAAHEVFRMIKILVLFVVIINEVVRVRQFNHVLLALMVGVAAQGVIALVQYTVGARLGLQVLGEAPEETVEALAQTTLVGGEPVYRVGALIGHANLLSAYLALLLPIGIAMLFSRIRLSAKILCGAALLVGQAALIATLSRSGWLSFGVALVAVLLLTFLHRRMRKRYLVARAVLISAVVVLALVFSGPILMRLLRSDPGAWSFRLEWLHVAWKMFLDKPIFGFGLNSFVFFMAPYTTYGSIGNLQQTFGANWPVVHNVYALVGVEQGIIGLAIFLALHVYIIVTGVRNLRVRNDVLYALNIGCLCGVGAVMIDGLASFFIRVPDCARVYWIAVAIIFAIHYWRRANELAAPPPWKPAEPDNTPHAAESGRWITYPPT